MKKYNFLVLLIPALLCACGPNKEGQTNKGENKPSNSFVMPAFTFKDAEEVAINITKPGIEVTNVEVINIPDSGIKVADWDNCNIKLHVSYNDNTSEDFPFLVKHFPIETRHYLGELGHHNIEIAINNHSTVFGFNVVRNPDFKGYRCQFYDAYVQGQVYETTVGYYQNVTYAGQELPDHVVGTEFLRTFIGWDYPLDNIHQDMIFGSVYRDTEKRFYGDSVKEGQSHLVSTYKDEDSGTYNVLAYLGRVHRVALNYGETIYHKHGDEQVDLSLQDLSFYNQRWEQLNKDILGYGLRYNFDNTAGQYLFGSNTGFGQGTTFLSAFESMYEQTSYTTTLDSGLAVTTSNYPNYATVYAMASDHKADTVTVLSELETGYYRAAVVANFDVYVSVNISKLANGKFELSPNSKFMFSPIITSVDVIAQFSETEDFINTYDKKVEYSNKMFYDIALGLNWGN